MIDFLEMHFDRILVAKLAKSETLESDRLTQLISTKMKSRLRYSQFQYPKFNIQYLCSKFTNNQKSLNSISGPYFTFKKIIRV